MAPNEGEPARFGDLEALFDQAVDLPPAEREAWVREQAGDDSALGSELLRLLRQADDERATGELGVNAGIRQGDRIDYSRALVREDYVRQRFFVWANAVIARARFE